MTEPAFVDRGTLYHDGRDYLAAQLYRWYMRGFAREPMTYEQFRDEAVTLGLELLAVNSQARNEASSS